MCEDDHCEERRRYWRDHPMTALRKKSTLKKAGYGLFADRRYVKGERVAYYSGTYSLDPTLEGDRVLQLTARLSIDGGGPCRRRATGEIWSTTRPKRATAALRGAHRARRLKLAAIEVTRDVDPGEELLIDYGPYYRQHW